MDERQRVHQLFSSFRKVNQTFYQTLLKAAQRHGLTPIQVLVLKLLAERPHIGLTELADGIFLSVSTTSGIVDRMVKSCLVTRERSETDRRLVVLSLTGEGETRWRNTDELRMNLLTPLLDLSLDDQRELIRIHEQIIHILQRVREDNHYD